MKVVVLHGAAPVLGIRESTKLDGGADGMKAPNEQVGPSVGQRTDHATRNGPAECRDNDKQNVTAHSSTQQHNSIADNQHSTSAQRTTSIYIV
jgi:hypothetical protein